MKKRHWIKAGLICIGAICLAGLIVFSFIMGKGSVSGYQTEDGGVLPMPSNSWAVGHFKINGVKFKTSLSEQEVKHFYQDYFDSLPRVTMPGYFTETSSKLYYDEQQKLIVLDELLFMHEWDGLYFAIMYEPYGDGVGVRVVEQPKNAR